MQKQRGGRELEFDLKREGVAAGGLAIDGRRASREVGVRNGRAKERGGRRGD
jgi:hypothetical protein